MNIFDILDQMDNDGFYDESGELSHKDIEDIILMRNQRRRDAHEHTFHNGNNRNDYSFVHDIFKRAAEQSREHIKKAHGFEQGGYGSFQRDWKERESFYTDWKKYRDEYYGHFNENAVTIGWQSQAIKKAHEEKQARSQRFYKAVEAVCEFEKAFDGISFVAKHIKAKRGVTPESMDCIRLCVFYYKFGNTEHDIVATVVKRYYGDDMIKLNRLISKSVVNYPNTWNDVVIASLIEDGTIPIIEEN